MVDIGCDLLSNRHRNQEGHLEGRAELDGRPDVASLLSSLHDDEPQVRREAALMLGQLLGQQRSRRVMLALRDMVLEDTDDHCRKAALYWLRVNGEQAIFNEALRCVLKDADQFMRMNAAWNISQAGERNPGIVEPLIQALESSWEMPIASAAIIEALGKLRDARAVEPLAAYLKSPHSYWRGIAAQALGYLGDPRAIPHLRALLTDHAPAWKEDHGPVFSVAEVARVALRRLGGSKEENKHLGDDHGFAVDPK